MGEMYVKKNGLLYSPDGYTVIGVDDTSDKFNGRVPFGAHFIDDEVFSECPYISISLPDSLRKIGKGLFKNSKLLEKVKLPALVTELPEDLFNGCSALEKVTMPNKLCGFSKGMFKNCQTLTEIPFREGIKVLPEDVFSGCIALKSLIIPDSVENIEKGAVENCTGLESVVFPESIQHIDLGAFEGCVSLHSIRINGESQLFYVNIEDGCLYMKSEDGDILVVKAYKVSPSVVSYFQDNVDDLPDDLTDGEFDDEDEEEDDDSNIVVEEDTMSDENNVDSMLADIMGEERERIATTNDVGVSEKESEVLSETMSVMEDSGRGNNVAVTTDELEKLFSKNEQQVMESQSSDNGNLDGKTKILLDSVSYNKVLTFEPKIENNIDSDLFVVAEKLVPGETGNEEFSSHLEKCCSKMAVIHDFKRVIMLYGLPLDNDEFMQFYRHFIGKKNIILACEADRPSTLSEYGKVVCDNSRISLEKQELLDQRRYASVKTDMLVKLVVRDRYDD